MNFVQGIKDNKYKFSWATCITCNYEYRLCCSEMIVLKKKYIKTDQNILYFKIRENEVLYNDE